MKRVKMLVGLLGVLMLGLAACTTTTSPPLPQPTTEALAPQPAATSEPLAATVNGQPIYLSEYERQMASYELYMAASGRDPSTPEGQATLAQDRAWVLDRMIEQRLMEHAAAEVGVVVTDQDVEAMLTQVREDMGEDAFQQYLQDEGMTLEQMRERLHQEMVVVQITNQIAGQVPARTEHVHARHILVGSEEEARQVLNQLQAGADFAELAQTYSREESTRDAGGDLGTFPRGILTSPEVEEVAFNLEPGQISGIVRSDMGYHIIQVVERVPNMEVGAESLQMLQNKAVREWLEGLWAEAEIERFVSTTP